MIFKVFSSFFYSEYYLFCCKNLSLIGVAMHTNIYSRQSLKKKGHFFNPPVFWEHLALLSLNNYLIQKHDTTYRVVFLVGDSLLFEEGLEVKFCVLVTPVFKENRWQLCVQLKRVDLRLVLDMIINFYLKIVNFEDDHL